MAKVATEAAGQALATLITAVAGCVFEVVGDLAAPFQARMRQATQAFQAGLTVIAGGDLARGCLLMAEGWDHLAETVHGIEMGRIQGVWVPRWDISTRPPVLAVGQALDALGEQVNAIIHAIATPGPEWTPGEILFAQEVLLGDVDDRLRLRPYRFNPPTVHRVELPDEPPSQ
jgi:hypothetical protein